MTTTEEQLEQLSRAALNYRDCVLACHITGSGNAVTALHRANAALEEALREVAAGDEVAESRS